MKKLELWYHSKPYIVSQAWGIYNPAYWKFGFSKHNGIDTLIGADGKLRAPCRMKIVGQEFYPTGGGNQVLAYSTEKWQVPHLDDKEHTIMFAFLHNKEFLHQVGDTLEVGDEIAVPDSTGFSTGAHVHFGTYRVEDDGDKADVNDANGSFDPFLYWNGFYAADKDTVIGKYKLIIELLQKVVQLLTKQ